MQQENPTTPTPPLVKWKVEPDGPSFRLTLYLLHPHKRVPCVHYDGLSKKRAEEMKEALERKAAIRARLQAQTERMHDEHTNNHPER